jgi:hypothetical protein
MAYDEWADTGEDYSQRDVVTFLEQDENGHAQRAIQGEWLASGGIRAWEV